LRRSNFPLAWQGHRNRCDRPPKRIRDRGNIDVSLARSKDSTVQIRTPGKSFYRASNGTVVKTHFKGQAGFSGSLEINVG
jgi:hypothetical protein